MERKISAEEATILSCDRPKVNIKHIWIGKFSETIRY